MSGPIIRKYGFPNFEKIFGERPLEHGKDEETKYEQPRPGSTEGKAASGQAPGQEPTETKVAPPGEPD